MQRYCSNSHKYVAHWAISKIKNDLFRPKNYDSGLKWAFQRVENGRPFIINRSYWSNGLERRLKAKYWKVQKWAVPESWTRPHRIWRWSRWCQKDRPISSFQLSTLIFGPSNLRLGRSLKRTSIQAVYNRLRIKVLFLMNHNLWLKIWVINMFHNRILVSFRENSWF